MPNAVKNIIKNREQYDSAVEYMTKAPMMIPQPYTVTQEGKNDSFVEYNSYQDQLESQERLEEL